MIAGLTNRRHPVAFTLIELLVVISIISVLLALGTPAVLSSIKSSRLTGAGEKLLGALSEAQQNAFSNNRPVEVRFYKYSGALGNDPQYRGYQFFYITTATSTYGGPEGKPPGDEILTKFGSYTKLPENVMISTDPELSPLLNNNSLDDEAQDAGVRGAVFVAIRFMTDGTMRQVASEGGSLAGLTFSSLPQSYVTLVEDDGRPYTGATPPKNFFTIQTDPFTGKSRSYRPGF